MVSRGPERTTFTRTSISQRSLHLRLRKHPKLFPRPQLPNDNYRKRQKTEQGNPNHRSGISDSHSHQGIHGGAARKRHGDEEGRPTKKPTYQRSSPKRSPGAPPAQLEEGYFRRSGHSKLLLTC